MKKAALKKFLNIYRKTPVEESLFIKFADLEACNLIKKRHQHRCFPVNIEKFFRTPILKNIWKCSQVVRPEIQYTLVNWDSERTKKLVPLSKCPN